MTEQPEQQPRERSPALRNIRGLLREVFSEIEAACGDILTPHDLDTGIEALDECGVSLKTGSVLAIASRPGVGKTTMAVQFAHRLLAHGYPVLWISSRTPARDVIHRLLSAESGEEPRCIARGKFSEVGWANVIKAAGAISERDLVVADQTAWQLPDILSLIEQDRGERTTRLVVIDSLDLIRADRDLTHEDEVEEVLRVLARAAREHDTTIVLTTNLTRLAEGSAPTLEDVRFYHHLERYVDTVLLLHRGPSPHVPEERVRDTRVVVAHDNAGARGSVRLVLRPGRQRLEEP